MPTLFMVTVKSIIQNPEGKVLILIKERGGKKYLDLPGGRIEGNDTFEQCIKRELNEELSLGEDINIKKQVGEIWEFPTQIFNVNERRLVVTFLVEANLDGLKLKEEHKKLLWLDRIDIDTIEEKGYILLKGFRDSLDVFFTTLIL
jgi:8-oxo-dGTP pyrophosphatase MutT (NUDIX family)